MLSSNNTAAIRVNSITKNFGEIRALDQLNLSISPGEIFGLVGPDGAGKTTTIRILTTITEPDAGEAWILNKHTIKEAEPIKEDIGYMSQRFGLYGDLSVMENLNFFADIYSVPRAERLKRTERLLAFSKLEPFKTRLARNLSGGMKQKLGLMCALIHTPKVLFLDEPTNGVDPLSRRDFWRILYQLLKEGVTIFVSTAYLDEAERCSRVGLLHQGKLLACDTPKNIKQQMHASILELRVRQARQAALFLRQDLQFKGVNLFGDRIHVMTSTPESDSHKITEAFRAHSLSLDEIRPAPPTLEDAFIAMLQPAS